MKSAADWASFRCLILVVALVAGGAQAAEPVNPAAVKSEDAPAADFPVGTIAERRATLTRRVADEYDTNPKLTASFFRAEALFEQGKNAAGCDLARRALETMAPTYTANRWRFGGNSGFTVWPGIDCYIRYGEKFDEPLKARFKEIYTGGVFYPRLSTSNHKIMAAVTRYLATQVWGADAFHPDPALGAERAGGNRFTSSDPTGEKYIRDIIAATLRGGPGEYASLPYGAENLLPLLTLAECAAAPDIRRDALAAYDHGLGQLAPAWLGGHIATFAPRSYPDALNQQPWGLAAMLWVYFGGMTPKPHSDEWALRAAVSDHLPPPWVLAAGTERAKPYVYRAFINGWALNHYITPTYGIFSHSAKAGGRPFQGQSHPAGLMWLDPDNAHTSQFWLTCPSQDTPVGSAGLHTHGVTTHEQELQRENALLYVFSIPADFRHPYALGYVPGGWLALDDTAATDGRILVHYGSVMISIQASQPFTWDPHAGIRSPATPPRTGDAEFRIPSLRVAVAVEAAAPADFPGTTPAERLAAFRRVLETRSQLRLSDANAEVVGFYTDRTGHTLECHFGGDDLIDGKKIDYATWPAHESPWANEARPAPIKP